ncbi:MAG: M28 family peptidase [Chitinophagales bacterium]
MRRILPFLFLLCSLCCNAQDLSFGRKIVDTLTSSYFWGRGYTNNGMQKAADFLAAEFSSYGLAPMKGKSFFQNYSYPVNTFPGKMALTVNGNVLTPGKDFIVQAGSKGVSSNGYFSQADSVTFIDKSERLILKLEDKLTMEASQKVEDFSVVQVVKTALDKKPFAYRADIENSFIKKFNASNVCAVVKGTAKPDSFIIITAHYDHLGGLGADTYFPGANDNASGVALLMNLAHYYAKHPQRYSIGFILFSGEEIGLLGSKYFSENPLIPLQKIRFLLNTDLAGTGDDGITVVNATEFPKEFELLQKVNTTSNLLKAVNPRGKAANSDHYFFTESGVPSFFFYTLGGVKFYHDVFDKSETLPLNEHEDLFKLVVQFNEKLMQ